MAVSKTPGQQAFLFYRRWAAPITMALALTSSDHGYDSWRKQTWPVSDPNVVPLIDVLLVLIIIFMVITPTLPTGLPTLIPQPSLPQPKPEPPNPQTIVVQVLQDGELMINQEQTDWSALGTRLSDIFKERAERVAFVKGAEEIPFAQMARAIDVMRGAGIDHVGLMTPGAIPKE